SRPQEPNRSCQRPSSSAGPAVSARLGQSFPLVTTADAIWNATHTDKRGPPGLNPFFVVLRALRAGNLSHRAPAAATENRPVSLLASRCRPIQVGLCRH